MSQCSTDDPLVFMAEDTTSYFADSVEWCPYQHLSHFFVCGTYQLDEGSSSSAGDQVRRGNVTLYKLSSSPSDGGAGFRILPEDRVPTSGILDMKWNPSLVHGKVVLASVCSDGRILLKMAKQEENSGTVRLSHLTDYNLAEDEERLLLSVDWSVQNENSATMITSDTKGFLNYFQVGETDLSLVNSWKAHGFESWVASFNYSDRNVVYSGGDDCCFKAWDTRSLNSPLFIKKNHSMGVTAITKSRLNDNFIVTGSYDENIFLWDIRLMKSPLSELHIGGGVWRLKWHPTNPEYLLSAAMHNGFHVLSLKDNAFNVKLSYTQHKSLAYGVDWSYFAKLSTGHEHKGLAPEFENYGVKNVIASCSFYDSLLHVWGIKF